MTEYKTKVIVLAGLGIVILGGLAWVGTYFLSSYYYERGREFYFQENYESAEKDFSRSLVFNSRRPASHMYLGRIALGKATPEEQIYFLNADYNLAISHYEKALVLGIHKIDNLFYAHTLEHLGLSYFSTGRYEKAREVYLQKINRFPNYFFGILQASTFWARLLTAEMDFDRFNQPEEALKTLSPLADPDRSDPKHIYRVYTLLARLNLYFDDFEKARKYAELATENTAGRKNRPEAQIAHNILALVAGSKKDFSVAENEIKKSNDIADRPNLNNCVLANAYYRGGGYSKAIEIASSAENVNTEYLKSICLNTLALSYSATDKETEAKGYFKKYLDLTEALTPKNIFIIRNRTEAIEALK